VLVVSTPVTVGPVAVAAAGRRCKTGWWARPVSARNEPLICSLPHGPALAVAVVERNERPMCGVRSPSPPACRAQAEVEADMKRIAREKEMMERRQATKAAGGGELARAARSRCLTVTSLSG
jgi:hypothetical protein